MIRVAVVLALFVVGTAAATPVPRWSAWLCEPGLMHDYCKAPFATTEIDARSKRTFVTPAAAAKPPIDCFYVYPTVSHEHRDNSDLKVDLEEKAVAIAEASRFSQVCRVFAPMYNQVTVYARNGNYALEYDDVLAAWRDYLAHWNHGRGVVLIGHSEGAFILKRLLRSVIEGSPAQKLLVSALLAGGNVTSSDLAHVPACRSRAQFGCIVAWSSWDRTPPADAAFQSVSAPNEHVVCTNPAAPAGGPASITPLFTEIEPDGLIPGALDPIVQTLWIEFPGLYTARCVTSGARAWLLVTATRVPGETRPLVQEALSPSYGLHAADIALVLGNLVPLVRTESRAWAKRR